MNKLLCTLTLLIVSGCGTSALPPPVTITHRKSLLGLGNVIIIKNDSTHHLYNVRVTGRNFEEATSASVRVSDHMAPGAIEQVGWLEFGAWTPVPGESIEVYADDYVTPKATIIPDLN